MNLLIDAMGGDFAPDSIAQACVMACAEDGDTTLTLIGEPGAIAAAFEKTGQPQPKNVVVVPAGSVITNEEDAVSAVKQKEDASVVVGTKLLKQGVGEAFISAGSTGALITASSLYVKRIHGVKRAALAPVLPSDTGCFLLLDAGANSDCKPEYYRQFGIMGSIYMNKIRGIQKPRVGIVNIGTERGKGTDTVNEAYALLEQAPIQFIGNIEAREIPCGGADVVVCDGFVGNVILKFYEGVGAVFIRNLKDIFYTNLKTKAAAMLVKDQLKAFKSKLDYTEYGGAILLGIDGLVIKAHGSSSSKAVYHTIQQAKRAIESNMLQEIRETIIRVGEEKKDVSC